MYDKIHYNIKKKKKFLAMPVLSSFDNKSSLSASDYTIISNLFHFVENQFSKLRASYYHPKP